jgi:hypothetical protein
MLTNGTANLRGVPSENSSNYVPGEIGIPLLQFNSRRMDRCVGGRASCTGLDLGCFLSISCPLTPGIRLYGVEVDETGDTMDSKERQENQGFPTNP